MREAQSGAVVVARLAHIYRFDTHIAATQWTLARGAYALWCYGTGLPKYTRWRVSQRVWWQAYLAYV